MAVEFKLPALGENIENGDVVNILVQEGQVIAANDGVLELETDKAVVEIPCPYAGRIEKILVRKGETVKVGQVLLLVDTEQAAESPAVPVAPAVPGTPAAPAKPAEAAAPPGVGVSAVPALSSAGSAGSGGAAGAAGAQAASCPAAAAEGRQEPIVPPRGAADDEALIPAGPAARRTARQLGVDLRSVVGSGARGRITVEDVQRAAAAMSASGAAVIAAPAVATVSSPAAVPTAGAPAASASQTTVGAAVGQFEAVVPPGEPDRDAWGEVRRERMTKIRQTIAAQMVRSATTIPHVTNFDDADVTDLEALRKSVPPGYLGANVKLTAMPFVLKAVALALRRHPLLNASLDEENQQIVYKLYVNIGVAVDTPRGLVVPAMRNVDRMSIPDIARALVVLAERARTAQFAIEDLRGGTFTVSNLGAIGGAYSTPIINHPEVAILLLGRSRWMPVVRDGRIEPRLMMPLSLSYDHRLVDGATAGRFLNEVIDYLQSPAKLLLS